MDSKTQCKESVKRRIRAGRLLLKGMPQAEVGLRGRPRSLDKTDLHELKRVLLKGALASGFATELWTLGRIRKVVADRFGVRLSESQISRILSEMGFSCQRPARRALQRDERAVREWKTKRWLALKKTPQKRDE